MASRSKRASANIVLRLIASVHDMYSFESRKMTNSGNKYMKAETNFQHLTGVVSDLPFESPIRILSRPLGAMTGYRVMARLMRAAPLTAM